MALFLTFLPHPWKKHGVIARPKGCTNHLKGRFGKQCLYTDSSAYRRERGRQRKGHSSTCVQLRGKRFRPALNSVRDKYVSKLNIRLQFTLQVTAKSEWGFFPSCSLILKINLI